MAWNQTPLTAKLGIDYPIVQGPMGGFPTQKLTAMVSNLGGLGSFGGLNLSPEQLREAIGEIRSLTQKPFSVNLWVSTEDEAAFTSGEAAFERSVEWLSPLYQEVGAARPEFKPYQPAVKFEDQVRVLLEERVPAVSFIFGIPSQEILQEFKNLGVVTIGSATTPDEAVAWEKAGIDVVAASGFEGGGHRGSFLRRTEETLMGTFSLVPQIVDRVSVPVIAAGGIADGRGIRAALALGAQAAQLGTAFLACQESGASEDHRAALLSGKAGVTRLTRGFSGRLGRGIENRLMQELSRPEAEILPYPLQRAMVRNITARAESQGKTELVSLWAGQSANLCRHRDVASLFASLISEV